MDVTRKQEPESLYPFIARIATGASNRSLASVLAVAIVVGTAAPLVVRSLWPLSALAGSVSLIAVWGILTHRIAAHPSLVLTFAQRLVVVLGTLMALIAGFAIYFGLLGPRWML